MRLLDALGYRESPELAALDISTTRVKLLELAGGPGRWQVEAYASEPMPAAAIRDQQIAEPELVGQAVARVFARAGCRQQQVALAVSGAAVISKIIDMPATLSEDEIEQQIGFEADAYIPYPIEDVSLDFSILGVSESDPDMQRVLLAACRRETVEMRVAAVEMAGRQVKIVDVEAYALQNACALLAAAGDGRTVAVVNAGATTTAVHVVAGGETIYTREQGFGGQHLVEEIQRQYELVSVDEALARLHGKQLDEAFSTMALPRFAEQLAQHIDRSLQFFFSHSEAHGRLDEILLTGGCALIPGVAELVQRELELPCTVANPLAGLRASAAARRNRVDAHGPALMVAAGLALRSSSAP